MGAGRTRDILKNRGIDNRSLNPRGILPRWVLLDQRQGFAVAIKEVGSDEGNVPASEDVEFDHNSGLCGDGCRWGGETKVRGGCWWVW